MLEILKFIFSSFWIWLGIAILISVVVSGIVNIVKVIVLGKVSKGNKETIDAIANVGEEE